MQLLARRGRAALTMAVGWGLAWAAVALVVGLVCAVAGWDPLDLAPQGGGLRTGIRLASGTATAGLTLGSLTGLTFAGVLAWLERRGVACGLAAWRLAAWGAFAGVLWQLGWLAFARPWARTGEWEERVLLAAGLASLIAVLGAGSGWLTGRLALARAGARAASDSEPPAPRAAAALDVGAPEPIPTRGAAARVPVA